MTEVKTEKDSAFEDYENNISITLMSEGLNYDKIKEI